MAATLRVKFVAIFAVTGCANVVDFPTILSPPGPWRAVFLRLGALVAIVNQNYGVSMTFIPEHAS
jgi:hypothetical protein